MVMDIRHISVMMDTYGAPSYNPETHGTGEVLERGTAKFKEISLYKITEKWLRGW
jgi:hypothetical protein